MQMIDPSSEMLVTILGSGTCVPSLKRSACSVLVETGGKKLLFDIGPGTMHRLLEVDTTIFDISYLFLSHFHPDHSGELVPFLFSTKYPDGTRRQQPLNIVAGKGFYTFFNKLKQVYGDWIELAPGLLNLIELDNRDRDTFTGNRFSIASIPMKHNDESLAYRVMSTTGRSVVYSGDTDMNDNLVLLAQDTDLLICESALPDDLKVSGHLTPSLAGKIATRSNTKKLVLTHFYPDCDGIDIETQCRKTYIGPLLLANDLMRIDIR
jgi:ribonuclease BN (tRNA processing enzyme)